MATITVHSVPTNMLHKGTGQPQRHWEFRESKVVRASDAEMEKLISAFEKRSERALSDLGEIKEECTTLDGDTLAFSLTGDQVKALIGHIRASQPPRS